MRPIAIATVILPPLLAGCAAGPAPMGSAPEQGPAPQVVRYDEHVQGVRSFVVDLDEPGQVALFLISPGHGTSLLFPKYADVGDRFDAGRQRITLPVDASLPADHCRRERHRGRCTTLTVQGAAGSRASERWVLLVRSAEPLDIDAIAPDISGYPHRYSARQTTRLRSGTVQSLSHRILERITVGEDWSAAVCRLERDSPYCVDSQPLEPAG